MTRHLKNQRGAAVVEFAVLSGLLIVFVFGIIEFGFIWLQSNYIGNAAREGARVAAKTGNSADRTAAAEGAVQDVLGGLYDENDFSNYCCGNNDFIRIAVDENASLDADGTPVPGIRVTVTVQNDLFWDPILWDLLSLLQAPDAQEIDSITQSAIFAIE